MSLESGFAYSHGEWNFTGYSLAGITTSVFCKTASVCFDIGQGLPFQLPARFVLLTHGHLDHAAGLPYLIAQKNMNSQEGTIFYVPPGLKEPLEQILKIWQGIDQHEYKYKLHAAPPGVMVELDKNYCMRPFATPHRVESQGYLLFQKKKRLKEKFRGEGQSAILGAKAAGEDPNEQFLEPVVAFTGDTKIEFLDSDPEVALAMILFLEVTFWDEERPVESARKWGHTHIEEFFELLPRLKNGKIVLIHASARYSTTQLLAILDRRLSAEDKARVSLFPRPN